MSYIQIDSQKLEKMCLETIKEILETREKSDRNHVERERKQINFWRKILTFGLLKPLTFEQVKRMTPKVLLCYPSMFGWGDLSVAYELIAAAELAPNVTVSTKDLQKMKPWDVIERKINEISTKSR